MIFYISEFRYQLWFIHKLKKKKSSKTEWPKSASTGNCLLVVFVKQLQQKTMVHREKQWSLYSNPTPQPALLSYTHNTAIRNAHTQC